MAPIKEPAARPKRPAIRPRSPCQIGLQKPPGQHLHQRPINEIEDPRHRGAEQIDDSGATSRRRGRRKIKRLASEPSHWACLRRPRARSRKTCSRLLRSKRSEQFRRAAIADNASLLQHDHPIAEPFDFDHIMRSEQDGGALSRADSSRCGVLTQSAVSGSSEAVGSSSSRISGSLMSAFAKATRVFCPAESWPSGAIEQVFKAQDPRRAGRSAPRCRRRHRGGEDLEILPDAQPMRHVDIGAFEIHPRRGRGSGRATCRRRAR